MKNKIPISQKLSSINFQSWFPPLRGGLGWGFLFLLVSIGASAQTDCKAKLDTIKKIMEKDWLFKDYNKIYQDILPCAEAGNALALNYLGLFYIEGLVVEKDEAKGFNYIKQSAIKNNNIAQNNLGNLFREGRGCLLDMDKAVKWYKKAANTKNARAAYSMGYMYLKGFGVPQDYAQAVSWFEKSNTDMAKHWLGVCHYLGYGVPQDTQKALEYFFSNGTWNSKAFLENLKMDKRDFVLNQAEQAIEEANEGDKNIDPEVIATSREVINLEGVENVAINSNTLLGEWTGRLIDYDWSGKIPLRVLPIDIAFNLNQHGKLVAQIVFEGNTFEDEVLFENNNLFLPGFNFKLDQLYSHSFESPKLDYSILGMDLSQKTYNNVPYLLADVDSFIGLFKEPGTPISLVLRPKTDTAITTEEDEIMLALAAQKTEFIKLYPVPFQAQLHVGFELINPAQVQVSVTSVATAQTLQVAATSLPAGMQSFAVDTTNLPNGYYVVRVQENQTLHTRIVIKQ